MDMIAIVMDDHSANLYTNDGHLIGMLDRDQRTAKYSTIDRRMCYNKRNSIINDNNQQNGSIKTKLISNSNDSNKDHHRRRHHHRQQQQQRRRQCDEDNNNKRTIIVANRPSFKRNINRKSNFNLYRTFPSLKLVLIYLLYIVSIPCTQSAPVCREMESNKDRMETHPKWVNPCGIPSDNAQMAQNMDAPQVTDQELLKSIIGQAKISLTKADRFKDDYARRVFSNNNFQQLHDLWKEKHYQWLPSFDDVPKNLGEDVSQDVLDEAKLDETLLNVYRSLQKIAVGLEQIVWDQEDRNGEFLENFRAAEYNLRALLCEIQMALYNRGVPIESDVVREWMPCEFRNMNDDTSRNLRDFFIYRDYMNALEYTRQVFEHLKGKL